MGAHRLSTAPRSLAVLWLQEGYAVAAAAMADLVSAAFMQATLAMTSSVAGLLTCRASCRVSHSNPQFGSPWRSILRQIGFHEDAQQKR